MSEKDRKIKRQVLFVDDDFNILDAYKRRLWKHYHIETAQGGEEGLEAITKHGPFAVIVSDLRMPGMDGNSFLSRVREITPESVRIMLSGHADLQGAMEAINKGKIFRLLTKPCSGEELAEALADGVEQYKKNIQRAKDTVTQAESRLKKRILIVDDDPVTRKLLTMALKEYSELELLTAADGKAAINLLLNSGKIDLVISDLNLPMISGVKLIYYINKNYPEIPIIVLTGCGESEVEAEINALGKYKYFEKPLDMNVFKEIVLKELDPAPTSQIHGISTASFLQLIDIEEKICTLTIRSKEKLGYLYFNKGDLIAAETGELKGEEAAYNIISWDKSVIEIENVCKKKQKEMDKPLMQILMESSRIMDEMQQERASK